MDLADEEDEAQTLCPEEIYKKMLWSGKIIWTGDQKDKFERLDEEKRWFKRVRLGLEKADAEGQGPDGRQKKPRPVDLISEKIMIGKYGPQIYQKKDYLGSHLLPKDDKVSDQPKSVESDHVLNVLIQSEQFPIKIDDNAPQPSRNK